MTNINRTKRFMRNFTSNYTGTLFVDEFRTPRKLYVNNGILVFLTCHFSVPTEPPDFFKSAEFLCFASFSGFVLWCPPRLYLLQSLPSSHLLYAMPICLFVILFARFNTFTSLKSKDLHHTTIEKWVVLLTNDLTNSKEPNKNYCWLVDEFLFSDILWVLKLILNKSLNIHIKYENYLKVTKN